MGVRVQVASGAIELELEMLVLQMLAFLVAGLLLAHSVHAAFIVRDGGLIYDDVFDITWMDDANYVSTYFADQGTTFDGLVLKAAAAGFYTDIVNDDVMEAKWQLRELVLGAAQGNGA